MFLRALVAFLALPGVVAFAVPLIVLRPRGVALLPISALAASGWLMLGLGAVILGWCVRDFYAIGRGTLAPWAPPTTLVVRGLYRVSRNPMYVGVLCIVAGWAVVFRSLGIAAYALGLAVAFHLRVVFGEEPWLARAHGKAWSEYAQRVPRWLASAVLVAWGTLASPAQAQSDDSLAVAIGEALAAEQLVGATWALVTPSGTVIGAAGLNDVARNRPMSASDRVQVGSVVKTVLATGVLALVTQGRVQLDAPLTHYLPDVPIENPWAAASPLRVRHLLDHTGGLDDLRMWQAFSLRARPDAPLREGLVRRGGRLEIRHRPGERFSYSNTSYLLLGMLIEAVTGQRYEAWLDAELLSPLGMTRSTATFVTQSGPGADSTLAMGHFDPTHSSATVASHVRPATQFTTTASDMARFARFLMSDGRVDGRVLVDSALLRAMGVPSTTEAARGGLAAGYGLGLARRDRFGLIGRCHTGNAGTFRAALCLYPAEQRAFFVAYNTDPEAGNFDRVDGMLAAALGVTAAPEAPAAEPSVDPAEWEGRYVVRPNRFAQFAYLDEVAGVTRVRWTGSELRLLPLQGSDRALTPVGGALFRAMERRDASHALLRAADGTPIISDGLRTLERVPASRVYLLWASALAGVLSVLYILVVGGVRSARALRRRAWRAEPLAWPALAVAALLLAPLLYLTQPFLAIGDPTAANVAVAITTGTLPIALFVAAIRRAASRRGGSWARLDALALLGALQWCVVLAFWGLLPLALWR